MQGDESVFNLLVMREGDWHQLHRDCSHPRSHCCSTKNLQLSHFCSDVLQLNVGQLHLDDLLIHACTASDLLSSPTHAGPLALARAASIRGDEYARHVAATGALVRNQAFVFCGRCDAQQLVHRGVLATRARHTAIRPAGISHGQRRLFTMGAPPRVA